MTPVERLARIIAADKMRLMQDPRGDHLPDSVWMPYVGLAEKMLKETHIYLIAKNSPHMIITIYEAMRLAERFYGQGEPATEEDFLPQEDFS